MPLSKSPATPASLHRYSSLAHIESVYPPPASCGDGVVNQPPSPFLLLGEECDGGDDSRCPGACIPPGDLFECTCATIPRIRLITNGFTTKLDTGWTGLSHNSA